MLGDVQLAGSNASAEEADEGTDEASESGVDLVLNHRLVETGQSPPFIFAYYFLKSFFIDNKSKRSCKTVEICFLAIFS